jgi:hypothetical protein
MKKKKAYVSPKVVRVKLEASQAILSNCSVGITHAGDGGAFCTANHGGRKDWATGDSAASS